MLFVVVVVVVLESDEEVGGKRRITRTRVLPSDGVEQNSRKSRRNFQKLSFQWRSELWLYVNE
jgi:hypothetical protein